MKYITFTLLPRTPERVTDQWSVHPKTNTAELGRVKWFASWRCYAFFPHSGTVFEKYCLNDIAAFCDMQTKSHRIERKLIRDTKPKA